MPLTALKRLLRADGMILDDAGEENVTVYLQLAL